MKLPESLSERFWWWAIYILPEGSCIATDLWSVVAVSGSLSSIASTPDLTVQGEAHLISCIIYAIIEATGAIDKAMSLIYLLEV